ncbi:hypothetical protein CGCF415_v009944 [Colletotrichum fructicola]|uniref:Uncharacterized protein n=1 Tax=Colletotrichum fructicola (strain Nara gc5) TaxID=1213859 RepID=L2FKH1_COLFN|nr:uncharacterized protein CGMCC3_g2637 [Colletotrichum fructicola]KAF4476383.1 hypothetical protein CGGC5_v014581 [Colletotrichum fructicola Nara gc5]KAE9581332.1 hypothetical protein CGMCC3_g2637 [Colletotrichum fructicola]KAF4887821.1 hypothetical protein CGCFRS4_v010260 [Colletotrichum fructicola]KAF4900962.1 hypothetical protein CGCF415_v009944 [Colletotrichum fructicola]KAF4934265.1 hypothetical protein CGCF245_v008735 [Colletotrichum fructicola]
MKFSISVATVMSLMSAALADDFNLVCWGTSVPDNIQSRDLEWAIKNRVTELGVPGGTTFPYKFHTCTDLENKSHEIAVIVTPSITRKGFVKLANGNIECNALGPRNWICPRHAW